MTSKVVSVLRGFCGESLQNPNKTGPCNNSIGLKCALKVKDRISPPCSGRVEQSPFLHQFTNSFYALRFRRRLRVDRGKRAQSRPFCGDSAGRGMALSAGPRREQGTPHHKCQTKQKVLLSRTVIRVGLLRIASVASCFGPIMGIGGVPKRKFGLAPGASTFFQYRAAGRE